MSNYPCAVILLAAGLSKRMGREKAFLTFDQKKTFLSQLMEVYVSNCNRLIIVKNSISENWDSLNIPAETRIITNDKIELGRSYSIFLALQEVKDYTYVFLQNIDNPFTDNKLIKVLLQNKEKADYLYPKYKEKGGHPLLLNRRVMDKFIETYSPSFHLRNFLDSFSSLGIEVENELFSLNINTPEDYEHFLKTKNNHI